MQKEHSKTLGLILFQAPESFLRLTMTGFDDLPNEIVLELWHHVLPPHDIASFALVSKRIFAFAKPFLKEHHRLKSEYSIIENDRSCDGSMLAHLLKDVLLNPHIAFYIEKVCICDWRTCWEDPNRGVPCRLDLEVDDVQNYVWHVPYPERDMELFRNGIRKAKHVLPSEIDVWIKLLESGHEDPTLALLLSLLPNLCALSLEDPPKRTLLFTSIRRMAQNAPSTSFLKLRSFHLADSVSERNEGISLVKLFALQPSMEKISCFDVDNVRQRRGIPDCLIAPQSSNVTELVFDSCGAIGKHIPVLLEGIKRLKKFTYVALGKTVDAFRIRSALLNHCRHSLEYLKMSYHDGEGNYMGNLRLFENLKVLHITHSLLVDPDAGDDLNMADLLPISIETIDTTGQSRRIVSHIRPFIRSLVNAKRTRLSNLKTLKYRFYDLFDSGNRMHLIFTDMCRLCQANGVQLQFE